jgi:hypothetical protein
MAWRVVSCGGVSGVGTFRYQLTVIGQFAQAIVAAEIANRSFIIKTSKPGVKVSWQVTGIRQDESRAWRRPQRCAKAKQPINSTKGHAASAQIRL